MFDKNVSDKSQEHLADHPVVEELEPLKDVIHTPSVSVDVEGCYVMVEPEHSDNMTQITNYNQRAKFNKKKNDESEEERH